MSWLELRDLFIGLPKDSRTKTVMGGDATDRRWTDTEYLLFYIAEMIKVGNKMFFQANEGQGDFEMPSYPLPQSAEQLEAERARRDIAMAQAREMEEYLAIVAGKRDTPVVATVTEGEIAENELSDEQKAFDAAANAKMAAVFIKKTPEQETAETAELLEKMKLLQPRKPAPSEQDEEI